MTSTPSTALPGRVLLTPLRTYCAGEGPGDPVALLFAYVAGSDAEQDHAAAEKHHQRKDPNHGNGLR